MLLDQPVNLFVIVGALVSLCLPTFSWLIGSKLIFTKSVSHDEQLLTSKDSFFLFKLVVPSEGKRTF